LEEGRGTLKMVVVVGCICDGRLIAADDDDDDDDDESSIKFWTGGWEELIGWERLSLVLM
jgi:hypothetical protein